MDIEPEDVRLLRIENAKWFLLPKGFNHLFDFFFVKDRKTYDLSAADLNQIERIEKEGLCIVDSDFFV